MLKPSSMAVVEGVVLVNFSAGREFPEAIGIKAPRTAHVEINEMIFIRSLHRRQPYWPQQEGWLIYLTKRF